MALPRAFSDQLAAFAAARVEYLIVGGYAVGSHARPRFTRNIDVWIGEDPAKLQRVRDALVEFGAPVDLLGELDRAGPDDLLWMGAPPCASIY